MTKEQYIAEMLDEILHDYNIPIEKLKECASDIIDGLDVYWELSGESVASSNRYQELEYEIRQAKIKGERALAEEENRHSKELEEVQRNARWAIQRRNEEIEKLEKQLK